MLDWNMKKRYKLQDLPRRERQREPGLKFPSRTGYIGKELVEKLLVVTL